MTRNVRVGLNGIRNDCVLLWFEACLKEKGREDAQWRSVMFYLLLRLGRMAMSVEVLDTTPKYSLLHPDDCSSPEIKLSWLIEVSDTTSK